jgi:type II secretory pathway component PulJ
MTWASRGHRAVGFTLIEMIAACALAAVLLLVLAKVTAGLRVAAAVHAEGEPTAWRRGLLDQLQRDLDLSTEQTADSQGTELELMGPLDCGISAAASTGLAPRPARVVYRLVGEEPRRALIRETSDLLNRGNHNVRRDLLAVGVTHWSLALLSEKPEEGSASASAAPSASAAKAKTETPRQLRVVLRCGVEASMIDTILRW